MNISAAGERGPFLPEISPYKVSLSPPRATFYAACPYLLFSPLGAGWAMAGGGEFAIICGYSDPSFLLSSSARGTE